MMKILIIKLFILAAVLVGVILVKAADITDVNDNSWDLLLLVQQWGGSSSNPLQAI